MIRWKRFPEEAEADRDGALLLLRCVGLRVTCGRKARFITGVRAKQAKSGTWRIRMWWGPDVERAYRNCYVTIPLGAVGEE